MGLNRKNKILVAGLLFIAILCYKFAISNTLAYYKEFKSNQELAKNNINDMAILENMVKKEKQLDRALEDYSTSVDASFQNSLLKQITTLSRKYNLKITDFKEPHTFADKTSKKVSYLFSLEGSFNSILLLINQLENNASLGIIKHVHFEKKRNYKNNTDYLTAEVLLQKNESLN